jgi:hypothetical protein
MPAGERVLVALPAGERVLVALPAGERVLVALPAGERVLVAKFGLELAPPMSSEASPVSCAN